MSAWDGLNRRRFPRILYPCLVTVRDQEEKGSFLTHTENIGIGGVCVVSKKNIRMFSQVDVELDLLDLENHIKCRGKVVWSVRRRSDASQKPLFYDIGIEFVNLDDEDFKRLEQTVIRLAKEYKEKDPS